MTREEAALLVAELAGGFPGLKLSDVTLGVYVRELCTLELEAGRAAVRHCLRVSRFFPSLAELLAGEEADDEALALADFECAIGPSGLAGLSEIGRLAYHTIGERRLRFTDERFYGGLRRDFVRVWKSFAVRETLRAIAGERGPVRIGVVK